jgi:hypothetical protein
MDLLSLYTAVLHGNLAPKAQEEEPIKNKAQFAVQNIEQVVNLNSVKTAHEKRTKTPTLSR